MLLLQVRHHMAFVLGAAHCSALLLIECMGAECMGAECMGAECMGAECMGAECMVPSPWMGPEYLQGC
jgi:hypothetical protein